MLFVVTTSLSYERGYFLAIAILFVSEWIENTESFIKSISYIFKNSSLIKSSDLENLLGIKPLSNFNFFGAIKVILP